MIRQIAGGFDLERSGRWTLYIEAKTRIGKQSRDIGRRILVYRWKAVLVAKRIMFKVGDEVVTQALEKVESTRPLAHQGEGLTHDTNT